MDHVLIKILFIYVCVYIYMIAAFFALYSKVMLYSLYQKYKAMAGKQLFSSVFIRESNLFSKPLRWKRLC